MRLVGAGVGVGVGVGKCTGLLSEELLHPGQGHPLSALPPGTWELHITAFPPPHIPSARNDSRATVRPPLQRLPQASMDGTGTGNSLCWKTHQGACHGQD